MLTRNSMLIPWLDCCWSPNIGNTGSEPWSTKLVCRIVHVNISNFFHISQAWFQWVVNPAVNLYPNSFSHVILWEVRIMYNKIIINCNSVKISDTSLDDVWMCGALRVFVLKWASCSWTNKDRYHSFPWSTLSWSHMPYSATMGLWIHFYNSIVE